MRNSLENDALALWGKGLTLFCELGTTACSSLLASPDCIDLAGGSTYSLDALFSSASSVKIAEPFFVTTRMDDRKRLTRAATRTPGGLRVCWLCCVLLPWWAGCSAALLSLPTEDSQSFLKAVATAPDSVALEIFQVRIPANDLELDEQLWQAVDEQRLSLEVRHKLIRNGFRSGVLGGTVPDSLAKYLKLESELPETSAQRLITGQSADPTVTRRVVQLNRHATATIQTSGVREHLNVLFNGEAGLRGRSFEQVQAAYTVRAQAVAGQRIKLRLLPELQHGELRNRYAGSDQGIFLVTPSREREPYDELELQAELTAGEFLVVGCLPDASGSLGHAFHAEETRGPREIKLVLVRLVEVPGSEILADIP